MTNITNMSGAPGPSCPPWLDLDLLIPPALRDRMAEVTDAALTLGSEVREWAIEAFKVSREYDRALHAAQAGLRVDLGELVNVLTGYDKLYEAASDMSNDAGVVTGEVDKPAWVDEVEPAYIGKQLHDAV